MGCGQSKINLYPRKNKNGKGNGAKKSGELSSYLHYIQVDNETNISFELKGSETHTLLQNQ